MSCIGKSPAIVIVGASDKEIQSTGVTEVLETGLSYIDVLFVVI